MSSKKEPEKENNNYINSYRYLVDSVKEISKIVLPSAEPTRESFKTLSDSASKMANSVASLYSPDNFSKELAIMADEMSQTLKRYLSDSITTSHDALESIIEQIADIQKEQLQKFKKIDFAAVFSSMYESIEDCTLQNLRDAVDAAYGTVQKEDEDFLEDDADVLSAEEVKEAIDEQINNPKGFQQRIKEWSEKK